MKILILPILGAIAVFGAATVVQWAGNPKAKITAHVIGEDGQAIPGADATFGFEAQMNHDTIVNVTGLTDANGNFTAEGYTAGTVGSKFTKDGYYMGWLPFSSFTKRDDLGHWLPWDATYTTVMRKIGDPIPMYVRQIGITTPTTVNQPCGYDLEKADWVAPYGKGEVVDFVFTVTNAEYHSNYDYNGSITLSFPNPDDGIQETQLPKEFADSRFVWPREAPETGYQPKLEAQRSWRNLPNHQAAISNTAHDDQAYFFRVRTVKHGDKIVSALYGKIKGGIRVGPDPTGHGYISFIYYLNPTPNDRNMEFDPSKNLAPPPPIDDQRLRQP